MVLLGAQRNRENVVKFLLFSSDEACCTKIASEKGALVLLSSIAGNLEHPALSNLAEEVLKQMENLEDNVQHLASVRRFEPFLTRLCEGVVCICFCHPDLKNTYIIMVYVLRKDYKNFKLSCSMVMKY